MRVEGRYDVRKGAAGYAPIIGTFGALAVPAIIVLFTVPHQPNAHRAPYIALAAGLLIVGMIGSLTGSLGMAGIAAEEDNTANLPPAIMLMGIPVLISLVTILAAFEVLAAFYLPDSKSLFAIITGVTGLLGSFFIAYTIGDSWHSGPTDPYDRDLWLPHQWIKSHKDAYAWADKVAIAGALPVAVGIILRSSGIHVAPSTITVDWLVGAGLAIIVMGFFLGVRRTGHPPDGYQRGVRKPEAFAITIIPSLYILALLIFLP
jgi:hypothetical protein